MSWSLSKLFTAPFAQAAGADCVSDPTESPTHLAERMLVLNSDPYLQIADSALGLLSVFDDLKYDRADADMLSPAMRSHAIGKLRPLGFKQVSGSILLNEGAGVRVVIPKANTLGASPFDITRYCSKKRHDVYMLTPTQAACQMIDGYEKDEAVGRIKALIGKHPINLFRLMDYLERTDRHQSFLSAIGHLKYCQRIAIESEPLCRRRALG